MATNPPPKALVALRPALEDHEVPHPSNGDPLPPPPSRYTPGLHEQICENIRKGNRPATAAGMAGIPSNTFYAWMKKGREGDPHLWKFAEDVELACHMAEGTAVASVAGPAGAFVDDPDNAKWWLERMRADGFDKNANSKVAALLEDFMSRLEAALPPEIFNMVIAAASGHAMHVAKPTFQLDAQEEKDTDESAGSDS